MPSTTSGQATYVASTLHSYDGLVVEQRLGAPGKQVKLVNQFQPATRRLTVQSLFLESQTAPGTFGDVKYLNDYGYDAAGNITSAGTTTNNVRDQLECLRYDYLRRLKEAWTQPGGSCVTPQRSGVDPYWRQWTFDAIGNRTKQIDKNTATGDTTWTYQVGVAAAVKPHQVKQITSTGPLAGPTRSFTYDLAGNTRLRTTDTGVAQDLNWDKEGHLETLAETGQPTVTYTYDASGRRLISSTPNKKTLYLPDGTELEKLGTDNPMARRHYGTAVRDAGGLKWIFTNHQASSTVQVDSTTLSSVRRRFMPYGEPRGPQPSGWLGTKSYVGGTKDDTGLTHLGAREYDPGLGRFVSVDPVMDLTDPQQWHAYSYSSSSPVTNSDPSGLREKEASDKGGTGRPIIESIARGVWNGWLRVNSAPIEGAWSLLKGTYQQTKAQYDAVISGQKSIGAAYFDWQMYSASVSIQVLISPITTVQEMIVEGSRAIDDAKSGDWQGAAEHATVATADFAYTVATVVAAGQALKGLRACTHSFAPATPVLMADGTTKPIANVAVGDQVLATDPETGVSEAKQVTQVHINQDQELTDLTIYNESTGETSTIHTTWHHPFWNATDHQWTDAANLQPGTELRDPLDELSLTVQVVSNVVGDAKMHDLTVADSHTYYVMAADTPVLVHNCGTMDASEIRFSQKGVSENFKDGRSVLDLADELMNGKDPLSVEPIRLVESNGNLFTLDNRRLVAFQIAEVPVPFRMATAREARRERWKFDTQVEGLGIMVRGLGWWGGGR
jgi:RHS repeat-associated protein